MNVWIINPFDPLPGDPEQEGRYASLARTLAERGHGVTWWTSAFSHRFKRPVDQATIRSECLSCGVSPRFLDAPPYRRNVGVRRLWNHSVLSRRFREEAPLLDPRPDVVVASSPPPGLALAAGEVGHARKARVIVDVQDLWPDNFRRVVPRLLRPLSGLMLRPAMRTARRAYATGDAITGVADAYVESALRLIEETRPTITIPLGVDLNVFDQAADAAPAGPWNKPPGEVWLAYTGSLNRSYDFLTIIEAAARIRDTHGNRVRFILTGRGELAREAWRLIRERHAENVTLTGFLDFEAWAYLLTQCNAGFNASFPDALIYLPNKLFYYLAAGVAVLNTIPGQCSEIVRTGGCGLDYRAGDVESCVEAVGRILNDPEGCAEMGWAARTLAETIYDRSVLSPRYADFIEEIAGATAGGA